jgi:predicted TIM-barrel fold metal-dependent hydrolase
MWRSRTTKAFTGVDAVTYRGTGASVVRDITTGGDLNGEHQVSLRGKLLFAPTDDFKRASDPRAHMSATSPTLNERSVERREFLCGLTAAAALATGLAPLSVLAVAARSPRRIDLHHHFVPPLFEQAARERNLFNPALNGLSASRSLDEMDRNGVASAVLSIPSPGTWYGNVELAQRIARDANDCAAKLVNDHKGRFGMFATLTLPDLDSSLAEVAYAFDQLQADGLHLWTNYGDFWLGDPRLSPLLEELNRRKAVVYTHPTTAACCGHLLPEAPVTMIEYGTDTTRTIASLVLSGTTNKYPDIRWIFSHAGGTMPFLVERFLFQAAAQAKTPEGAQKIPHGVLYELRRLYFETAQSANPYSMGPLTRLVSKTQICFGTDFPYRPIADNVSGLATCGLFSSRDLEHIERANAARLLPRLAK